MKFNFSFRSWTFNFHAKNVSCLFLILILFVSQNEIQAASGSWASKVTGGNIVYTITESGTPAKDASNKYMTVVYLENLNINKLGASSNATDVAWLLSKGYRVVELDYANHVNAVSPKINDDIVDINDAIFAGSFCGLTDCSLNRSYVLFEGYRIARDVSYFKDDPTVYNYPTYYTTADSMYMDIVYPANASVSVPVVLSFSYSNSWGGSETTKHQRLNLGNTLAGFNDSFLEGAPANGIAWAIADHPKYCDWGQGKPVGGANKAYGGYETNPDAAKKVKSAVRTLRSVGTNLGLSGKIGIYGFSRGSTAGSMAIGDKSVPAFENAGLFAGVSDDVQAAALGSGVFDYTLIFNTEESDVGNLRTNCPLAWGPLSDNLELWKSQGSSYLVETQATAPVLFFYNTTDASYYQDQIVKLKAKLDGLSVATSAVTNYGSGHSVPQTGVPLTTMYNFFKQYLLPPSVVTGMPESNISAKSEGLALNVLPGATANELKIRFNLPNSAKCSLSLYNGLGMALYQFEKQYESAGIKNEDIRIPGQNLPNGVYFINLLSDGVHETVKFTKR